MPNYNVIKNNKIVWEGSARSISDAISSFIKDFYEEWFNEDDDGILNITIDLPYISVIHDHKKNSDVFMVTVV